MSNATFERPLQRDEEFCADEALSTMDATTIANVRLHRADAEDSGKNFEPGLTVTAVLIGDQLWHLTAELEGILWEGPASSQDIEASDFASAVSEDALT